MKAKLKKSALLTGALLFSVLVAEAAIRVFAPEPLSGSYRVATASGLLVNKSSGSARHQFRDRIVRYHFAPPHLRDSRLDESRRTILCLGDSFTFGYLLEHEDTFVHGLQQRTDGEFGAQYNFVIAAAGGWGAAEYVAYVDELGEQVQPDIVLVFLNFDDIGRAARRGLYSLSEETGFALTRNSVASSQLKRGINSVPGYSWLVENSHLMHLCRRTFIAVTKRDHEPATQAEPDTGEVASFAGLSAEDCVRLGQALFLRLDSWCREHEAELYVTTTGWHLPPENRDEFEPTRAFRSGAAKFFARHSIPYRDVSFEMQAIMGAEYESYLIPDDHHPNEMGAQLIADMVFEHFLREQLRSRSEN